MEELRKICKNRNGPASSQTLSLFFLPGPMRKVLSTLTLVTVAFSAAPAFAATAATDLKVDILENLTLSPTPAAAPARAPAMESMTKGGAGMMASPAMDGGMRSSLWMPPYQGGVTVDVTLTKEVKPDIVILNAWCQADGTTRESVRSQLDKTWRETVAKIGRDGRVRRTGVSVNVNYGMPKPETSYMGTMNIMIRFARPAGSQTIADWLSDQNCSMNWDVRLSNPQDYEMTIIDELVTKLAARKAVFEKLLNKKLTDVQSAYFSTYLDGYSSFDPETNTVDATTTLSVTFAMPGMRKPVTVPTPVPLPATR